MAITSDAKHLAGRGVVRSDRGDPARRGHPGRPRTSRLLTDRDRAVLDVLRRYGCVSLPLLARWRFDDVGVRGFGGSETAARERLRKLERAGYLVRVATVPGECGAYRLTDMGLAEVAPGRRALRRRQDTDARPVLHAMLVAEVAAWHLARRVKDGGTVRWYSEQDIRDGLTAPWLTLPHRRGNFRLPDGVFEVVTLDGDVHRVAVEVERRAKRPKDYPDKLAWYRDKFAAGDFEHVRWFAGDAETERAVQRQIVAAGMDDGRMTVGPLPNGVRLYGAPFRLGTTSEAEAVVAEGVA
jgi:hypothetical protein